MPLRLAGRSELLLLLLLHHRLRRLGLHDSLVALAAWVEEGHKFLVIALLYVREGGGDLRQRGKVGVRWINRRLAGHRGVSRERAPVLRLRIQLLGLVLEVRVIDAARIVVLKPELLHVGVVDGDLAAVVEERVAI